MPFALPPLIPGTFAFSFPQYSLGILAVTMTHQPLASLLMHITQGRAASDHHPHREFGVGWRPCTPLPFSYQEFLYLLHIQRLPASHPTFSVQHLIVLENSHNRP